MNKVIKAETAKRLSEEGLKALETAYMNAAIKYINREIRENASRGLYEVFLRFRNLEVAIGPKIGMVIPSNKYHNWTYKVLTEFGLAGFAVVIEKDHGDPAITIKWDGDTLEIPIIIKEEK